jgi:hypothetical protein
MVREAVSGKMRIESLIESTLTTIAGGRGVCELNIIERVKIELIAEPNPAFKSILRPVFPVIAPQALAASPHC